MNEEAEMLKMHPGILGRQLPFERRMEGGLTDRVVKVRFYLFFLKM